MVICSQKTGLELAIRSYPEPVAISAELGIVQRTHDLHLCTIETVFLAVVHPARENPF